MSFKSTEKDSSSDHQQSGSNIKEEKDLENLTLASQTKSEKKTALIKEPNNTQMFAIFEQGSLSRANIGSNQNDTITLDPSMQPVIQANEKLRPSDNLNLLEEFKIVSSISPHVGPANTNVKDLPNVSAEIKNSPKDDKETFVMGNIDSGSKYHTPCTLTVPPNSPNEEFSLPTQENLAPMYANPINKSGYINAWLDRVAQELPFDPPAGPSHGMLDPSHRMPRPSRRMMRPSAVGSRPPEHPGRSGRRAIGGRRNESSASPGLQRKSIEKPETKGAKRYETKHGKGILRKGLAYLDWPSKSQKNDKSDTKPNFKPKKSEKEKTSPRPEGAIRKKGKKKDENTDEDTDEDLSPAY